MATIDTELYARGTSSAAPAGGGASEIEAATVGSAGRSVVSAMALSSQGMMNDE